MTKHPSKLWLALLFSLQAAAHGAPVIELAPGEPTSITATPWQYVSFTVHVSGGDPGDPWLYVQPLNVGSLEDYAIEGDGSTTFTWRVMPGQLASGIIRLQVTDALNESDILEVPVSFANATAPQWWTTQSVLTGGTARDFAMANQGQLKSVTKAAYDALKAAYPDLDTATSAGEELATFVNGFSTTQNNYVPVAHGQAKNAANLVYRALDAVTEKGYLGVPWSDDWNDDQHNAPANIGQIKTLFSFPLPAAGLFNELPEVELTSPTGGTPYDDEDTITISANASDSDGTITSVAFYANGTLLSTDAISPYSFAWSDMDAGDYVIKAVATDNRGATRLASMSLTVDPFVDTLPSVAITSITDAMTNSGKAAFISPAAAVITATASDADGPIQKVEFYVGSTLLGEDAVSPYTWTMNPTLAPGTYTVKAVAYGESFGHPPGTQEATSNFTVTQRPNSQPSWIDLQEGVIDFTGTTYSGTFDTYISNDTAVTRDTNYGSSNVIITDDGPARAFLIKWDLSKLANIPVTGAEALFRVNSPSGKVYGVFPVLRAWDENTVTWNSPWATAGAANTTTDRGATEIDWVSGGDIDNGLAKIFYDGALMRSWRDNPSTNYGVIVQNYVGFPHNRLEVHSSEASTASNRPILRVYYRYP